MAFGEPILVAWFEIEKKFQPILCLIHSFQFDERGANRVNLIAYVYPLLSNGFAQRDDFACHFVRYLIDLSGRLHTAKLCTPREVNRMLQFRPSLVDPRLEG